MKQVYLSDVSSTPPTLPSGAVEGYPQDGTLAGSHQATVPGSYWFYQVSSEIENAIRAGGLTPSATSVDQLATVISSFVAQSNAVSYLPQTLTAAQQVQARANIGAMSESAIESRNFLPRLAAPSFLMSEVWKDSNSADWGASMGVEDAMLDPQDPDVMYVVTSGLGQQGTLWKCAWDGTKYVAQISSSVGSFNHQGNSIYRPEGSPVKFFGYTPSDKKLVLRSWSGVDGAAPVVERTWTVLTSDMTTANSVSRPGLDEVVYSGLAPTVSPDQKKLLCRMVRASDAKIIFRVWDIEALLASSAEDQSETYEASVEEPDFSNWSLNTTYDISRQSVAFDGQIIYCLDSHTGNSSHYVKAFDLLGQVACERPASIEGKEQAALGNYEGESLTFCRDRLGRLSLLMAVNVFDDTERYTYVYDIASSGISSAFPWSRQWESNLVISPSGAHTFNSGSLGVDRQASSSSASVLAWAFYGTDRGRIGLTSSYTSVEDSAQPVRVVSGVNGITTTMVVGATSAGIPALYPLHGSGSTGNRVGVADLGIAYYPWKDVYSSGGIISTSDERAKANIAVIEDDALDAWGEVGWMSFQMRDALAAKGEAARIHAGVIAQRVIAVFAKHGLDASRYGLLCHDAWDAAPETRDDAGNIAEPAREAGERFGIRYEEALAFEAAYQRRRADRLEARIEAIEKKLGG